MTLDKAVEVLEIMDLEKLDPALLEHQKKQAKKRWHPDTVAHLQDQDMLDNFTRHFQSIEPAVALLTAYLNGEYQVGEKFNTHQPSNSKEPYEIIRENAPDIQLTLNELWQAVQEKQYKYTVEEVNLTNGFILKDLLREDFREDIAMLSIVSFLTYCNTAGIITIIVSAFNPTLATFAAWFWLFQALFCFLAFLPLSRFWLPNILLPVMYWFVDVGLGIYNWLVEAFPTTFFIQFFLLIIRLFAKAVKYLLLFPLYEIAKLLVGKRIVGASRKKISYYAHMADWYIEELLQKNPDQMLEQELYDLSYLYTELADVKRI